MGPEIRASAHTKVSSTHVTHSKLEGPKDEKQLASREDCELEAGSWAGAESDAKRRLGEQR